MGLHLTRWVLGTANLLLAGLLTCFWIFTARDLEKGMDSAGDWLILFSLITMTVTACSTGIACLMRRTLPLALKWNTATGLTWVAVGASGLVSSLLEGRVPPADAEVVAAVSAIGLFWFFMGWCMRQFMYQQNRRTAIETHALLSGPLATTLSAPATTDNAVISLPVQEAIVLSAHRRG